MRADNSTSGVEELRDAALAVGLVLDATEGDTGVDLVLVNPTGGRVAVQLKRTSLAAADGLDRRIREWAGEFGRSDGIRVLVADRVTAEGRRILRAAGWGWLDLRGHLHLAGNGFFVDADVPRLSVASAASVGLTGQVSAAVAAWLLLHPDEPAGVREIARVLGRSASTVSKAIADMRAGGLVDDQRRPVVPDLFWQLAADWEPADADLQNPPTPTVSGTVDVLRMGLTDLDSTIGWALTDTAAAAAYGAPVGVRADHPPDFYVPDQNVLRRTVQLLGGATNYDGRAATVRLAPFPLVCSRRVDRPGQTWPLARPLFVALDLARDLGRGREILDGWTPPPGIGRRVW
ncbi:winged helix-turn-helix domain-containing protein [Asanoa siamensis]|uniref:HTH marR-type domain-containing protein n=1 Tax=Asanoa siamensis TaxID=926357 RepID=A0ABQ4CH70_9ACTN|nr:winged helix-turn-helix domain-containing protein [Asanoa siamensis]GIF70620.1 hypothetical protein Asi02nite_01380 [Asanoa siamensis]